MRLAGLQLQLKRVAHEQKTRVAVSSRVQQTNECVALLKLQQAGQLSIENSDCFLYRNLIVEDSGLT
jgi:hypothetical protein